VNSGTCNAAFSPGASPPELPWTLTLSANVKALWPTTGVGSALRIYRHARYELYQAADGEWYLGYRKCATGGTSCDNPTPVSGPYLPSGAEGASGLEFRYFDASGARTAATSEVRRVEITLRSRSERQVNMPGRPRDFYVDSLSTIVTVRN
jgi:hypothetical protein